LSAQPHTTDDISVVMAVRNGERFVKAALDSVLSEPFGEFIVVDDGSCDATPRILDAVDDARFRVIRRRGRGLASSLACAVSAARGPLIARMDADDLCLPGRFSAQVDFLNRRPDVAVVGTAARVIDENGACIGERHPLVERFQDLERGFASGGILVHGSVMMRRQALLFAGNYNPHYLRCEDHELWTRMVMRGLNLQCLDVVLYAHRKWSRQMSADLSFVHWHYRRAQLKYLRWLARRRRDLWEECAAILHTMVQEAWEEKDWRPARRMTRLLAKIDAGGAPYLRNYLMTFAPVRALYAMVKGTRTE